MQIQSPAGRFAENGISRSRIRGELRGILVKPEAGSRRAAPGVRKTRPGRRWVRRLAWSFGALCLLAALAWLFRAPLLSGLARAWVVDEPLVKADAIVVLGGHPELRAVEAARLYHLGLAPRILYMDVKIPAGVDPGIMPSEREVTRRLLLSDGVPESAMTPIGAAVANTYEESCAVRDWALQNGAKSILVTTDLFHTRRALHQFKKEFKSTGVEVRVHAVVPPDYGVNNWWRQEDGFLAFQNEVLKSVYYCFAH